MLELFSDVFSQEFGTGVGERKQEHVLSGQENPLSSVTNFDRIGRLLHFQDGALALYQSAVIELVAHTLHQGFEPNEVENDSRPVQFTLQSDSHLIVMSMEGLPPAVRENKKMRRREIKIILGNLDGEAVWHEPEGSQKPAMIQVCKIGTFWYLSPGN
jgi:hypothetical protein